MNNCPGQDVLDKRGTQDKRSGRNSYDLLGPLGDGVKRFQLDVGGVRHRDFEILPTKGENSTPAPVNLFHHTDERDVNRAVRALERRRLLGHGADRLLNLRRNLF